MTGYQRQRNNNKNLEVFVKFTQKLDQYKILCKNIKDVYIFVIEKNDLLKSSSQNLLDTNNVEDKFEHIRKF